MTLQLSARARLTALYTSLVAVCGGVLVAVTYLLLSHNLQTVKSPAVSPPKTGVAIQQCVANQTGKGATADEAERRCSNLYANGVKAGATAQRSTTLNDLLVYSLTGLVGVTALAGLVGWSLAGRILRPVHQLTAAARQATEQNLSHRLALTGPRDELRELADTFDEMLERLDNAFHAQQQFIANASHELRTPLTVMRTSIDVALAKPSPTPDDLISMSTDVRQAVDHAERLIDALLILARSERAHPALEAIDLAAITEDVLETGPPDRLLPMLRLNPAPVTGERVLLERLVANLVDNAHKYNVPQGSIAISTATEAEQCVLRITNTGAVVPPTQVDRLFLPFTRVNDRTRHDGFGLGLALVRAIATAHSGTVTAVPIPTGGLDVAVRLPARQTPDPLADACADQQPSPDTFTSAAPVQDPQRERGGHASDDAEPDAEGRVASPPDRDHGAEVGDQHD